jgi:hypothetical protein
VDEAALVWGVEILFCHVTMVSEEGVFAALTIPILVGGTSNY